MKYVAGTVLLAMATGALAEELRDIELRRLFDPTEAEVASEAEGRIYIYDGLTDVDVQRALNEEFDRVEHMMLILTKNTDERAAIQRDTETGAVEYEDNGC